MKPLLASLTVLAILAGASSALAGKKGKERKRQLKAAAAALASGNDARPAIEPGQLAELRPSHGRIVGDIALQGELPGRVEVQLDAVALDDRHGLKLRLQPRVLVAPHLAPGPGEIPHLWVRIPVGVSEAWGKHRVIEHTFRLDGEGKDHLASLDRGWVEEGEGRIRLIEAAAAPEAAYYVKTADGETVKSAQKGTFEDPNVRLRLRASE